MIHRVTHFFIVSIVLSIFSHNSWAKETTIEQDLIEKNKQISRYFDGLATDIDSLLSSRKARPRNQSRVSLVGFANSVEGQGVDPSGHIDVDLRLPNLEQDLKLQFSSYDKEDEFEGLGRNRTDGLPQQQKYGTSVAFARTFKNIRTTLRPRLELKNPLVSSFLLRFDHNHNFSRWTLRNTLKLFAHSIDGTGQSISVDFERGLTRSMLFRWFNEQQYLDRDNILYVAQGPMLLMKLNEVMALSYTFSLNSQSRTLLDLAPAKEITQSYHLSGYRSIVSFSHSLYKNVFHYQISPSLSFYKYRNFKGEAGVLLRTEIIF